MKRLTKDAAKSVEVDMLEPSSYILSGPLARLFGHDSEQAFEVHVLIAFNSNNPSVKHLRLGS